MKNYQFLVFFSVVLTIYSLSNTYIFFKGYNVLAPIRELRIWYTVLFILLASSFIAGKFLEALHSSVLSDVLNIIGGFWLGLMLYATLFLFLSDVAGLILKIPGILNPANTAGYRKWAFLVTLGLSLIFIIAGFINAIVPVTREYNLTINKSAGEIKTLRIAAVSDIHLGSVIRKRSVRKLSVTLEKLKPDLILLLGDIVDGEIGPVLRGDLLGYFKWPQTREGLFAITGNHEYIGGAKKTIPYIESKGIKVLKDETVTLTGGIQLTGRLDRDSYRFAGKERLPLNELMKNTDKSKPLILLDHQPFDLGVTEQNGVDLQLSGHTHNGQMWPLNYFIRSMYELGYGYLRKGNTHFIVSSGYGLWGPRIRLGSRSEVLLINLKFSDQGQVQ